MFVMSFTPDLLLPHRQVWMAAATGDKVPEWPADWEAIMAQPRAGKKHKGKTNER
jgi:hypothetical protein